MQREKHTAVSKEDGKDQVQKGHLKNGNERKNRMVKEEDKKEKRNKKAYQDGGVE